MKNTTKKENKEGWDWEEELFELAEKYCKHNDGSYNSCLYHIFLPYVKKVRFHLLKTIREEIEKNTMAFSVSNTKNEESYEQVIRLASVLQLLQSLEEDLEK